MAYVIISLERLVGRGMFRSAMCSAGDVANVSATHINDGQSVMVTNSQNTIGDTAKRILRGLSHANAITR